MAPSSRQWRPTLAEGRPLYLAVADALTADIASGRLKAGDHLPTQRDLASALSVNLTTVTRAYKEAQRRGLIDAGAGRGTFVSEPRPAPAAAATERPVDLSMNLPPQPPAADLRARLAAGFAALARRAGLSALLTYGPSAGGEDDRAAATAWLRPRLGALGPERVLVCGGAQAAMLALLTSYATRGAVVLTEALTYPGFRALAAHFGIRLQGVPLDAEGIVPDALERACRSGAARVLYLTPTIHNPTTATMSERRRRDIAAVIRRFELTVLEDDAYGFLPQAGPPPLATFAPERVFYFTGMAKCVAPGLRIAFLVAPDEASALRLTAALRATTLTVPPLMAGLATQWIKDGTAAQVVAAVRGEAAARQAVARALLPSSMIAAHPEGHHVWLALQPPWTRIAFDTYLRQMNLAVTPSDAFVVGDAPLEAVRLCLGAAPSSDVLRQALERIRDALFRSPAYLSAVV